MKKEYKKPDILVEELLPESFLQIGSPDEEIEKKDDDDDYINNIDEVF